MTDIRNAQELPDEYVRRLLGILIEDAGGSVHFDGRRMLRAHDQSQRVPHIIGWRSDIPGSGVTVEVVNHDTIEGKTA